MTGGAVSRLIAVFFKELVQMRRDRLTFAILIGMPVMQLVLFGYAINTDARNLPTIVEQHDDGPVTRRLLAALRQSTYFDIIGVAQSPEDGEEALRSGRAAFLIVLPEGFERRLVRGERPELLIAADASDPIASGAALRSLEAIAEQALRSETDRGLPHLARPPGPIRIITHARYNPASITAYNIVPGLLGIILTMTLVMITSIALTREAERGTLETLLASPVTPGEVMIGKTTPYILIALTQIALVLFAAELLFNVPFTGPFSALAIGLSLFVLTNLMLGFLISTVARSQMQAMQMTFFVFLPSVLLSGFMFPFASMPIWARIMGECLPITHFLRIVRAVMLKGAETGDLVSSYLPLAVILILVMIAALLRYRRTLD